MKTFEESQREAQKRATEAREKKKQDARWNAVFLAVVVFLATLYAWSALLIK